MLRVVTLASAPAVPTWMVQVEAGFTDAGRPVLGADELEPMVEFLYRTEGVSAAMVVPRLAGLAAALSLVAHDPDAAIELARKLVRAGARYAGLGDLTIERVRVTPQYETVGS